MALKANDLLADAHEDRLQRLESDHQDMATKVAEQTVKLEYMSKTLEKGFEDIGSKIEACISPLTNKLNDLAETVDQKLPVIQKLEAAHDRSADRAKALRKALYAVLLAGGGMLIKEVVVSLYRAL